VVVDDFGAGYSSIGRLAEMPAGFMKIDRSLLGSAGEPLGARTLIGALVQSAADGRRRAGRRRRLRQGVSALRRRGRRATRLGRARGQLAIGAVESQRVAFTYAGSDTKGGAATLALNAQQATVADEALGLACTGCVLPSHLSPAVADAFVSAASGGAVGGSLEVTGTVSASAGLAPGLVDISNTACDGPATGRMVLGSADKRIWFCDGSAWQRLVVCGEVCLEPSLVACGQPLPNGCGVVGACAGQGSQCPGGELCVDGACKAPGTVPELPAISCKAILDADANAPTGTYWLDPDEGGPGAAYAVTCDMDTAGGGWMVLDNAAAFALLDMTTTDNGGVCQLTADEVRSWDGFGAAPGDSQACLAKPKASLAFPTYSEVRKLGFVLTWYTSPSTDTFDLGELCTASAWCVGPAASLVSVNTAGGPLNLENGVTYGPTSGALGTFAPTDDFQIFIHETGGQAEGAFWDAGAILLR
jgi:hypothetical protein